MPTDAETEELQVTSRSQWKGAQKEGQLVPLPSGNVVRIVRTMDLLHLLKAGKIPNPLAGIVQGMVDKRQTTIDQSELDMDTIKETMKLVDDTVLKVVTEPKIVAPPDPEEGETEEAYALRINSWEPEDPEAVPLTWLDMDDRMFIFVFAQGFAADLATFRAEPDKAVAPASPGKRKPQPTKRTGRGK